MTELAAADLRVRELCGPGDLADLWNRYDLLAVPKQVGAKLLVGLACSDHCVELALRLRYEVFDRELGHGTEATRGTGIDRDRFDAQMTHLVLVHRDTGRVVGTYRVQTVEQALQHNGIYSGQEFDLGDFESYFPLAAECGRACIEPSFRKATSLLAMWSGLHAFMTMHGKRWLFGCCSISSVEPDDGWRTLKTVRERGSLHPELFLPATPAYACGSPERESHPDLGAPLPLPKLFATYMRLGVRVVSQPALDREFGTIDFLIVADGQAVKMSNLVIKS